MSKYVVMRGGTRVSKPVSRKVAREIQRALAKVRREKVSGHLLGLSGKPVASGRLHIKKV